MIEANVRIESVRAEADLAEFSGGEMERAFEQARAHRFDSAWSSANAEADPLRRDQARVHVLYAAGDLEAAAREAEAACARHPRDPWLCEQSLRLVSTLRRARAAREALSRFEALVETMPAPERDAWLGSLAQHRSEVGDQEARAVAVEVATRRSRLSVVGALALLFALWFVALRVPCADEPSP